MKMKKLLAIALAVIMCVEVVPLEVWATEPVKEETVIETTEEIVNEEETDVPFSEEMTEAEVEETEVVEEMVSAEYTAPTLLASAEASEFTYKISDSEVTITGYEGDDTDLVIPAKLENLPVTTIGKEAFQLNQTIKSVVIPEGVTYVMEKAFDRCRALEKVVLPDSVETMGYRVFAECTSLTEVNYPRNWTKSRGDGGNAPSGTTGGSPFAGCTALTNIEIPEGITEIAPFAFANSSITSVEIPDSVETIGWCAFYNTKNLKNVTIPASVKEIGLKAFMKCDNLKLQILPIKVNFREGDSGEDILYDSENVTIYCPRYSDASIFAINEGYSLVNWENNKMDLGNEVADTFDSSYIVDTSTVNIGGYVNHRIEYSLTKEKSNPMIRVYIPDEMKLNESTIYLNGDICTTYGYKDNILQIKLSEMSGEIRFHTEPMVSGAFRGYAMYYGDSSKIKEIIDVYHSEISDLTISAKNTVSDAEITVSGIAPKQTKVKLYINEKPVKEVTASKAGKYNATIEIENPVKNRRYIVKAVAVSGDKTYDACTVVTYQPDVPKVTEFKMYYGNKMSGKSMDLLNMGNEEFAYFNSGDQYTFTVNFNNREKIQKVFVTSTRNNEKRYLEAEYDEDYGCYVANGSFHTTNKMYVPGKLAVEFYCESEQQVVSSNIEDVKGYDKTSFKDAKVTEKKEEDNSVTYSVDMSEAFSQMGISGAKAIIDYNISQVEAVPGTTFGDLMSTQGNMMDIYSYFVPGLDNSKYVVASDSSDPSTYVLWIKDLASTTQNVVQYKISLRPEGTWDSLNDFSEKLSTFNTVADVVYDVVGFHVDHNNLLNEIQQSSHIVHKVDAMKRADQLYSDQVAYTIMMATFVTLGTIASGGTVPIAYTAILSMIGATSSFFWDARTKQIIGAEATVKWAIDPSGYVYEGVTANRVSDAKVTVYYKESLETPDSAAVKWDATEFDQVNPLYTDTEGRYAWDVPEGYWQVKCEKDGYVTTCSDWLEVPPPQTEVHLRMVPETTPEVETIEVQKDKAIISFSQYMTPSTVSNIVLKDQKGTVIAYELQYSEDETDLSGNIYAKQYTFVYNNKTVEEGSNVTISVPTTVLSADGAAIKETTIQVLCKKEVSITVDDTVKLDNLKNHRIPFVIENYDSNMNVVVTSAYDEIVKVKDVSVGDDGHGYITVERGLPGQTALEISIEGTTAFETVYVSVVRGEHVHDFTLEKIENREEATCTKKGSYEKVVCCKGCGVELSRETVTIDELDHTEEILPGKAATCEGTGLTEGKKCSVCKSVLVTQNVVAAKGHTKVVDRAVAATCTKTGLTEGSHCSVCNKVIVAQKSVPAGHDYKVTKTTKATTKKNGKLAKQCKVCKYKTTETLYRAKSISLSKTKFVYNGKTQKPIVVVKDSKGKAISTSNYKVSFSKGCKNVGTYKVTVTLKGQYSGKLTKSFKITKAKQVITANNFIKQKSDKAFSINAKRSSGGGKLTYKTSNKKIATVSSKGKVTIKKAGKVTITITAAANKNYSKATKKITITVN